MLHFTRMTSTIGTKLEASIIFLQLEVGLFTSFFTSSYTEYGFLTTKTLVKQIWSETEPYGLQMHHNKSQVWLPTAQGKGDQSLMTIACQHFNKRDVNRINRYCLFLRVTSIFDILTYDGKLVHPEIARGHRVISRKSTIHWVDFPKPPKNDAALWTSFLENFITPIVSNNSMQWDTHTNPTYRTTFMQSIIDGCIYDYNSCRYRQYQPKNMKG